MYPRPKSVVSWWTGICEIYRERMLEDKEFSDRDVCYRVAVQVGCESDGGVVSGTLFASLWALGIFGEQKHTYVPGYHAPGFEAHQTAS